MKTIYICEYTGKQFDNKYDCEVSEYNNGNEHQQFFDLVHLFIEELQKQFSNIVVDKETLKMHDNKEFYLRDRITRYRYVKFKFTIDGIEKDYYRTSDEVGDCRWDWDIKDTVESFITDFKKEFIYPKMTTLEGVAKTGWSNNRGLMFAFNDMDSNYFLKLLANKKLRIEILEDYSENEFDYNEEWDEEWD